MKEDEKTQSPDTIAERIEDMPASDGARVLEDLSAGDAADVAESLDPNTAGRFLARMEPAAAASVVSQMEVPEAAALLDAMNPDDRVDLLAHVGGERHEELVGVMDASHAADVRSLEQYPSNTAGGLMTSEVTALYEYITVENAVALLRRLNEELEQMFYVYVINRGKKLVGVLSMRDLILARPEALLRDIMIKNCRSLPAKTPQHEVAGTMRKFGYLAMPVVDDNGVLLGLVTIDDVVDVISEEATEDFQRMFGAGAEERLNSPWQLSFRKRVWWLQVNLGTAFLAGAVVGIFQNTIEKAAVLAVYMPIIAGMGGNASAQAMAVAVRGISTGRVDRALLWHVIRREMLVGLLTGLVCGLTTAVIALLWQRNPALGIVVFLALLINHTLACTTGAGIPFIMKQLGFDPAQSATIFATTVTDIVGFLCLLGLATMFMQWLTHA